MTPQQRRNLLKTIPGFLISGFFLWFTFHKVDYAGLRKVRLVEPSWMLVAVVFLIAGYTLRSHRWWLMMHASSRAKFSTCARVLMTSFAANNIMPLRIGDFLRVFSYAGDLNSTAPVILSTVVLERVLDVFTLLLLFVATMGRNSTLISPKTQIVARVLLLGVSGAVLVLLLAAAKLKSPFGKLLNLLPHPGLVGKIEARLVSALDAIAIISLPVRLALLLESFVLWACEGMIFVAVARALGIVSDWIGPWGALAFSNLSYLIPSSPGAVGTFEFTAKLAMVSHGAAETPAVAFALVVHVFILFTVTAAGGFMFLSHRAQRGPHPSLTREVEELPAELP
ncbi:lysylphosphatidylglycerol synthase transmembrane domain-containing protein [Terriglobus albidus]|uniref:lysylphosphatidylglycerol synthase transmembrane domain-containing protein n=1 Tax=Terriglobus albidus TaxID=1592106 RepID=UPI0021E02314|nr:lysylphosphatidylglycerol synthase transmembrane domain-containing protein [Terriglobus albidus]